MNPLVYVSVTSIHDRQQHLVRALQGVLNQTYKTIEIHVWLSSTPFLLDKGINQYMLAPELSMFLTSHPEIKVHWVPNTGSFRKLLPMLQMLDGKDALVLTIDDDIVLDPKTIETYVSYYTKYSSCICSNGKELILPEGELLECDFTGIPMVSTMAVGNYSVLYNAKWFTDPCMFDPTIYQKICKSDDDLWFHLWLVHAKISTCCLPKDTLKHRVMVLKNNNSLYHTFGGVYRENLKKTIEALQTDYGVILN